MAIPRTAQWELRLALVVLAADAIYGRLFGLLREALLLLSDDRWTAFKRFEATSLALSPVGALGSGAALLATLWLLRWPKTHDTLRWGIYALAVLGVVVSGAQVFAYELRPEWFEHDSWMRIVTLVGLVPYHALRLVLAFRGTQLAAATASARPRNPAFAYLGMVALQAALTLVGVFVKTEAAWVSWAELAYAAATVGVFTWWAVEQRRAIAAEAVEDDEAASWWGATRGLAAYVGGLEWVLRIVAVFVPAVLFGVVAGSPGILSFASGVGGLAFGIVGIFVSIALYRLAGAPASSGTKGLLAAAAATALAGPYAAVEILPAYARFQASWDHPTPPVLPMVGSELLAVASFVVVVIALARLARLAGDAGLAERLKNMLFLWIGGIVGVAVLMGVAIAGVMTGPLMFVAGGGAILGSIWFLVRYTRLVAELRDRFPEEGFPAAAPAV